MRTYALLLFVVGCSGAQWKPLNDFKKIFKEYSAAAVDTISSIQHILDNSTKESDSIFNDLFKNYPENTIVFYCVSNKSDLIRDQLRISFQNQLQQFQVPLKERVVDIEERLNMINTTLGYYEIIAEYKYCSCKSRNKNCLEETNDWLETFIDILSFGTIKPTSSTPVQNPYVNCSTDESDLCKEAQCSPECGKKGGVCLRGPEGAKCLFECPPGTYETTKGCSSNPEKPLSSLPSIQEVLEDTPRLITRYEARFKYLKTKTILEAVKSTEEVLKNIMKEITESVEAFGLIKVLTEMALLDVVDDVEM